MTYRCPATLPTGWCFRWRSMTTLRISPRSTAGAVMALLIASLFVAALAEAAPGRMKYACARNANGIKGLLHLVGVPRGCRGKGKIAVASPSDSPVHVCVSRTRGLTRLVDDPARCRRFGPSLEQRRDLPRR